MLFIPALGASVGGDGDMRRTIAEVLNNDTSEQILDMLEEVNVLLRDSIQNSVAAV